MKDKLRLHKLGNMLMLVMLVGSIFAQPVYGATELASEIGSSQVSEVKEEEAISEVSEASSEEVQSEDTEEIVTSEENSEVEANAPPVEELEVQSETSETVSEEATNNTDTTSEVDTENAEDDVIDLTNLSQDEIASLLDPNAEEQNFITLNPEQIRQVRGVSLTKVTASEDFSKINSTMYGEWEIYKANGHYIFCIQPGLDVLSSATSTSESASIFSKFSGKTQNYIGRVISSSMQHYSDSGNNDYVFAGQLLIWDYISDHERSLLGNPIPGNPAYLDSWTIHNSSEYGSEIDKIETDLDSWTTRPSFTGTQSSPKGHTLSYDSSTGTYSIILKDTNGVWDSKFAKYGTFGDYTLSNPSGANNVKIKTSSEHLTYSSTYSTTWHPYASGTNEFYDGGQDLVFVGSDPVKASMKFKTAAAPVGSMKLKKVDSETGKALAGAKFGIYTDENNDGKINGSDSLVKTITTNTNGVASASSLDVGNYTLKETKAPTNYKLNTKVYNLTISSGRENRVHFTTPIENDIYKGGFKIKKVDSETGKVLAGTEFTLYDSTGAKVKIYTTNSNGIISSGKNLRPGHYTLKETKAPEGYVKSNVEHSITIKADEVSDYTTNPFKNDIIRGGFELTKLGEIFQLDNEELADIEFTVTSTTYPDFNKVYTTDENGQIITAGDELKYGNYHIEETKAPSKYVIDFEQDFSIKKDGVVVMLNGGEDIINKLYLNKIHGLKVAETFDNNDSEMYPLAGTTFGIYEELGTPNGEVDRQDHLIDLQVTDENGEFTSIELPEGNYVLKELEPSDGYNLNETNYPFEIKNDGTLETHSTIDMGTIENEVIRGKAQLIKVGSKLCDKEMARPDTIKDCQTLLPDVSFAVYQDLNNNGVFDKQESKPVDVMKTDKDGLAVSNDLKYGHYFVKEINNPADNYFMNDNVFEFTIDEQDEMVFINNGVAIENIEKLGNIHITKSGNEIGNLNDDTVLLADAEYTIYNSKGDVEDVLTTDENGEATSVMLSFGNYHIEETKAPEGYALDETEYEFTIDNDSYENTIEFDFTDEVIENEVSILKTDLATGDELPGANLTILEDNGTGNKVDSWTSTEEAHVINLEYGKYMIIENYAPEGYAKLNQGVKFEVTEDGIKQDIKIKNELIENEIHIKKTDFATGEEILGAHLKVINIDTEETVEKWTSTEEEHVFTLPYGNYMVIETIAPDGYQRLDQGVKFEVTEDGVVQHLAIENKLMEMAVTGGNNKMIIVTVGLVLVLGTLVTAKRKVSKATK